MIDLPYIACLYPSPVPERTMPTLDPGPSIDDDLVRWLDAHAGRRLLRLPVTVELGVLGIRGARICSGDTSLPLHLDTSALSRSLPALLAGSPPQQPMWLQGTWGPLVGPRTRRPTLAVRSVIGPVEGHAEHVWLVGPD